MINKIDHIGIAVEDLEASTQTYRQLGFQFEKNKTVASQRVETAFFRCGDTHIELLAATDDASPIAKFISKRGSGIHHICVEVDDIHARLEDYRRAGIKLIHEEPFVGAMGCLVAFVHPRATNGVLLELKQKESE